MKIKLLLIMSVLLCALFIACGDDDPVNPEPEDQWFSLPELNDAVGAMLVFDGKLMVGGNFTMAGEVAASRIAEWDGTNWQEVGGGVSGGSQNVTTIYAMAIYDSKLIIAGRFSTAGDISVNNIAAWDGNSWAPLGSGIDAIALSQGPLSMVVYDDNLVVGGSFNEAGGEAAEDIAFWNGSTWAQFGGGITGGFLGGGVTSLVVYNNDLVAGGSFTLADDVVVSHIAMWDGMSWNAMNTGLDANGKVWELTVYNNDLVAAGDFSKAGDHDAEDVAIWNGSSWSGCGSGIHEGSGIAIRIEGMTTYQGDLIVGGMFSDAGDIAASNIAKWDGSSWSPLGGGVDEGLFGITFVTALQVYEGKLYVGGSFTEAGSQTVGHIAGWDE